MYSSVRIGLFSFEVEKLLCFNICRHFKKKRGLICGPLTLTAGSPPEGGGIWHKDEFTRWISKNRYSRNFKLPLKSKVALNGKSCQKGVPNISKAAKKLWRRFTIMCFFGKQK